MKRKVEMYPYAYTYKGKKTILIWQTNGRDTFKLVSPKRLLQAPTLMNLKRQLRTEAAQVHWSERAEIDFDKFWTALENLRSNRASSRRTCSVLLKGWNFIEDMGRTFNLKKEMKRLRSKLLDKAYEKIFYGCNLPSVTPNGKSYSPLWSTAEIKALRTEHRAVWQSFISQGYIQQ
jgi:hypothetical protein